VSDAALFERPIVITNRLSLHGAGATGRDRHRGRRAAGADAARFRARRLRPARRSRKRATRMRRAGARRRSRGARHRGLRRRLPRGPGRGRSRAHRHLRRQPERPATEYGYISPGEVIPARSARSRNSSRSRIRQRRRLHQGRLSLEQRQLHVPRRVLLDEYRKVDAAACRPSPMP
jgi:mannose-1-phosphate guanylyltransferase/mannose-6-phosphate isomerase